VVPFSKEENEKMSGTTFSVRFENALREDLLRRLSDTRWSDAVTTDWQYGMKKSFLQQLVQHWQTTYNFDAAEERMNFLPQFRTSIAGFCVHYVHVRGRGPRPRPLLLMNGWPSSFVEYRRLAPMLADPAAFGGSTDDAFDVIMPALPGFGFSDRPTQPHQVNTEELFHRLMTEHLGYVTYIASGTDIGAGVATRLALKYPHNVRGIHISSVVDPLLTAAYPPLTNAEKKYKDRTALWEAEEGAYEHVHYTKPQTLAFALADSPVGLASWIVEKFYSWTDHDCDLLSTFPFEMLIDNLMIYWATETIGSSIRLYYEHRNFCAPFKASDHVSVPTAVCMWPRDLVNAPRKWAERFYNVQQYSTQKSGGHFPAWEVPDAYAHDVRRFAKLVNRT
jgi:pimeloyl-ACP methyl ester carboxylesterase